MARSRLWIIGGLALSLSACSSVRLAYGNAPLLTWWWLDGYIDFSREQTPQAKQAIDNFFDWHRSTQLSTYLPVLANAQVLALEPTTAAAACRWQADVRDKLEPTLQRALNAAADLLPGLAEPQFQHLAQRYAKANVEMRSDFMQADPAERQAASVKRALDRAEMVYGRLGDAQRRVIEDGVAASPFNADLWLQERQRRQADTVQTLRRLAADNAPRETRLAALRTLAANVERSPDADYRAYQVKLADYNCALAAQLHNATTPAQRQRARETFKGWEDDLRSLIGAQAEKTGASFSPIPATSPPRAAG